MRHSKTAVQEIGVIRKDWRGRIRVALVYPNRYAVGMSNLGFQTVYALLNDIDAVLCERAFLPENDTDEIRTIETKSRLSGVDIIAFSVSFEQDYLNILSILEKAGIPLRSCERDESHPMVIAGGVACFSNPEPISAFTDCILIGEAEAMPLPYFFDLFAQYRDNRGKCLELMAQEFSGVYVPAFAPHHVRRAYLKDISQHSTSTVVLSKDTAFDNSFLIEVSRGCPHGCRFCSAGYIYRPPRFRTAAHIIESMDIGDSMTDRIGLVGAAVSDLPNIGMLCDYATEKHIRLSFSSFRADALLPELIGVLNSSRVKTATIAPEAGSERMRKVINKGITEAHILSGTEILVSNNIPNLKLYFMIGLPTETDEDILEIVSLCKKIKAQFLTASRVKGHIGEITVSINSFVPKPFTPFQWAAMDDAGILKKKISMIRSGLKGVANLKIQADDPKHAIIQALLSRGNRNTADMLVQAHRNNGNWAKTLKEFSLNPESYPNNELSYDDTLPWEFIDHGIDKSFLIREYERAKAGKSSPPCSMKFDSCKLCGVCG